MDLSVSAGHDYKLAQRKADLTRQKIKAGSIGICHGCTGHKLSYDAYAAGFWEGTGRSWTEYRPVYAFYI